jgi:hypothetical protein
MTPHTTHAAPSCQRANEEALVGAWQFRPSRARLIYRYRPKLAGMQYGLCFRASLRHLVDIVLTDGKKHRLHVVIERGHKHVRDAERIFNDTKERLKSRRGIDLLGDFTIAKKEERAPLVTRPAETRRFQHLSRKRIPTQSWRIPRMG